MIADRDHEIFFDLGCLASDFRDEVCWQDCLTECLNQSASGLVLRKRSVMTVSTSS